MSEAFDTLMKRIDLDKYIDQIEEELKNIMRDAGPTRSDTEIDAGKRRLQDLLRRQTSSLAKETGVGGNYLFVFMLMSSVLTTGWTAFALKRGILDMNKAFDERLRLEELLSSVGNVLEDVIARTTTHADMYGKKPDEG